MVQVPRDTDGGDELLVEALELAVETARRDASARDAPPPPGALRPVLAFHRLPRQALLRVRDVLDQDSDFRERVARGVDEASIGRASWLFLTRPEGWQAELESMVDLASAVADDERTSRDERRAERRVTQLEATVRRLREELASLGEALESAERLAGNERSGRARVEQELAQAVARIEQLESERARAVRSLKDVEGIAAARLDELRELRALLADQEPVSAHPSDDTSKGPAPSKESAVESSEVPPDALSSQKPAEQSVWEGLDPAAIAAAVTAAGEAARLLAGALADAAAGLGGSTSQESVDPSTTSQGPPPPHSGSARRARRVPIRVGRGLTEESAEGLAALLGTKGVAVLVDGYNVAMEGWPALDAASQRDALVTALGTLRSRTGAQMHVVFDGTGEGGRPAVAAPLPVRVHFSSEATEADDLILEMVADLPAEVPVVVISTDRRVADGARRRGANAVRSRHLLDLLS
jgi:predicted RNA-binding protein with PIN domain